MATVNVQRKIVSLEKIGEVRAKGEDKEQDVIEVRIFYSKGGINYFTYKDDPRGYYLSVTPKTIETRPGAWTVEKTMMFSGYKSFLEEAQRFSAKKLDELVAKAAADPELKKRTDDMRTAILAKTPGQFA